MKNSIIEKITKSNLCLGCGLCEAICGEESVKMSLNNDGFYFPEIKNLKKEDDLLIKYICPGLNVINKNKLKKNERIWGHIEKTCEGFTTDSNLLKKSSSGGVISSIAIYLLEQKIVNGILHVGVKANDYKSNQLKISRTKEEIVENCSSRYAPAIVFSDIIKILNENRDTYCFVGKPCDIAGLQNFLLKFPDYKNRIKYMISLICAGMPSYIGTEALINEFKPNLPIKNLKYRGNGWPGYFSFTDNTNKEYIKSYNDSWGKVLNKHLHFRCKICPDGIGLLADIAVGDSWETKNGYPNFDEKTGKSLIIIRNRLGVELISKAKELQYISIKSIDIDELKIIQPFQYDRRRHVGSRIIAFYLIKHIKLNFKNLRICNNLFHGSLKRILLNFSGTFKRTITNC